MVKSPVTVPLTLPECTEYNAVISLRRVLRRLEAARGASSPSASPSIPSRRPQPEACVVDLGLQCDDDEAMSKLVGSVAAVGVVCKSIPQNQTYGIAASALTAALAICAGLEAWRHIASFIAVA